MRSTTGHAHRPDPATGPRPGAVGDPGHDGLSGNHGHPHAGGVDDRRRAALVDIHVFPKRLGSPSDFAHLVRSFMENTMLNGETVRLDAATRLA
jgi:hypothetical protein